MLQTLKQNLTTTVRALAKPALLFYVLPWLMFLLVMGTVSQRYLGLYSSEKLFFGSFILWLGPVPLPGAYSALALIALGLMAKLTVDSKWNKAQAGIILAHVSVLVLLIGALVSASMREEGYMVLAEGAAKHMVADYHERELVVIKNGKPMAAMPTPNLHAGEILSLPDVPFTIAVLQVCRNCALHLRAKPSPLLRGLAAKIELVTAALMKEDEENQSGATLEISGAGNENGIYITSQALAKQPVITLGKDHYEVFVHSSERELPFTVSLKHFDKVDYPGTDMAKSYRSDVMVNDGALSWNASIEMNQPLRYRGYTLYQASYVASDGKLLSVLAVVKNAGAYFPYLAIATLCAGLLLHLIIAFSRKHAS